MRQRNLLKWVLILVLGIILGLLASYCTGRGGARGVDLEPDDPRPISSIQVGDAQEAALLEQQLGLEIVRLDGSTLYYHPSEGLEQRLRELGYQPGRTNAYEVFRRVVRVDRRGSEPELTAAGVNLINREDDYWVVEGSLANLRSLADAGYRLRPAREPRPREVRIQASGAREVERIVALHVDVYSVQESRDGEQGGEGLTVYGGAFDNQIDRLREEGFTVELISTVEEGGLP